MILCCGEALIDMLPIATPAGEQGFAPYPGGSVFNTAVALGRLGIPVEFFSGISSDFFGTMLRDMLAASNAGIRYAHISDRPTTLAFVRLVEGHAEYVFYDENTAGRMLAEADLPALDASITALHFGAISLVSEPCGSTYEALMRREHGDRVIVLDPNIRPDFIADPASHRERLRRMMAMADVMKLSDQDLAWFAEDGTVEQIARRWLDLGPKLIVITHGAAGAAAFTARCSASVPAKPVEVIDTVGAGDTFTAGLLASLHEAGLLTKPALGALSEDALRAALSFGAGAAAVAVSRRGANPPWREELEPPAQP